MKISYNWLKEYVQTDLSPEEVAELLTGCGLEVEGIEQVSSIAGGLDGIVVGKVLTKEKHPDADRLSLTTVDVGNEKPLQIVCGAQNVDAGQTVLVATIGSTLYPSVGEPFEIKKSKIRGQVSEGMICAEDEIGLGSSHDGIMVLEEDLKPGTPAREHFIVEHDTVFEIGLTPNRADATSHVGVARDLVAVVNSKNFGKDLMPLELKLRENIPFETETSDLPIEVEVKDEVACPRYSGVTISGVKVGPSPAWLKFKLEAIGVKSINNIVDATNYVLHELGQPIHAFDYDRINGKKVIVQQLPAETKFITLDDKERRLTGDELMICDEKGGMCIAGVFGGANSGVTEKTINLFIESACFHPTHIRRASSHHDLKTDASFRYERGSDPAITVYALKRVVELIKELAGGEVASELIDIYPNEIKPEMVAFSFKNCDRLIGQEIEHKHIKKILSDLGIVIDSEGNDGLKLMVPLFKVDVNREADVIEEILRVYGYNNIGLPKNFKASLSFSQGPNKHKVRNVIGDFLSALGFSEIMATSLTKESYVNKEDESVVKLMNSLSSDLGVLRKSMLHSGLEAITFNLNRKASVVSMYEFGNTYHKNKNAAWPYKEEQHLSLFISGARSEENWREQDNTATVFTLKGILEALFTKLGLNCNCGVSSANDSMFNVKIDYMCNGTLLASMGVIAGNVLKQHDIKQEVYAADINMDRLIALLAEVDVKYKEVSKFPEVRRDLAMLVDKNVQFNQLQQIALLSESKLLKHVSIFDVYEGDKLEAGKKSYALSFVLQDDATTLTEKRIDKVMAKLQKDFEEKAGAKIR